MKTLKKSTKKFVAPLEADEVIVEVEISRYTLRRIEKYALAKRLTRQAAIETFLNKEVATAERIWGKKL